MPQLQRHCKPTLDTDTPLPSPVDCSRRRELHYIVSAPVHVYLQSNCRVVRLMYDFQLSNSFDLTFDISDVANVENYVAKRMYAWIETKNWRPHTLHTVRQFNFCVF